jgi:hypothetical protein
MPWTNPETFTAGQTLTAASMNVVSENLRMLYGMRRLANQTRTTNYSVTSPTATGNVFSSAATFTADGTSTYIIEWSLPFVITGAATNILYVMFYDGATQLGQYEVYSAGSSIGVPVYGTRFYTPAAGSRSIQIAARQNAGTGEIRCGDGTGGNYLTAHLAVYGPVLT